MKFVVAVVMLAIAACANASLYAAHYAPAVSYVTSHGPGPYGHGGWGYPWAGAPAAVAIDHSWGHSAPGLWHGTPGISLSQGPGGHGYAGPIAAHSGPAHGHEGVYVAKTRGAIHTAPLAGHVNSATSLNLAPAPGTH